MGAISAAQESQIAAARMNMRQDKKVPLLINTDDFRLMPNVPKIAALANYRPYPGKADDSVEVRKQFIERGNHSGPRGFVNSAANTAPFDLGTASKDELVTFAMDEYGIALDPSKHLNRLRAEFTGLVASAGAKVPEDGMLG